MITRELQITPIFLLFSELRKIWKYIIGLYSRKTVFHLLYELGKIERSTQSNIQKLLNMWKCFSLRKKWILNPLGILHIPQNFWTLEWAWNFTWTIWCFNQACNMWKKVYFQQWVHNKQGAKFMFDVFSVIRNDF